MMPEKLAWKRYKQTGCARAKQALLDRYRGLVFTVAQKIKGAHQVGLEFDDLVCIGEIGLLKAIETFDAAKGAFTTRAHSCIHGAMRHGVRDASHLPAHVQDEIGRTGRRLEEHASHIAFSQLGTNDFTFDETMGTAHGNAVCELFNDPAAILMSAATIDNLLKRLTTEQRMVIEGIHIERRSYAEIAESLGVTQRRVSVISTMAMRRLRK